MRWEFPDVDIGAGSYLVIYASAKDRIGQELHTSFTLDRDGEYLALVAPDGVTVISEIAPQYPEQFEGVSYGVAPPGNPLDLGLGYFEQPTPGSGNGTVSGPPPVDVVFSETSRMFTEPFSLELNCPTPGAVIRYTTDRTVPATRSMVYHGPIPVSANTQVRARAFVSGGLMGAVTAHAYLRLTNRVAGFSSDLPIIVISSHGTGTPPSTSSTSRKAVSMLFFEPDPETGRTLLTKDPVLTTRAGIRRRGSSSGNWPKYSLSVETWRDGDDEDRNIKPLGLPREADWILNARYEWDLTDELGAFIQPSISHSASKFTDIISINRLELDSYTVVDLSAGVSYDQWRFEVYGANLFDERAQIAGDFYYDRARIVTNRPLTVGAKATFSY
jgi:hypothetical protein